MKCCSKTGVGLAMITGLGIALVAVTGVGPALWNRVCNKIEKQVPPEVQIEQVKIDIEKLDRDIQKNWTLIATYEHEIKSLEGELARKQAKIKSMEKELAAAADEIEAKVVKVRYEGRDYKRADALRLLDQEANRLVALKREVDSKEKLLVHRKDKLSKAMAIQHEMHSQKDELKTQVAKLEADLEALKLIRAEKKLPVGESTRLDKIKHRLSKLQADIEIQVRANELSEQFNSGTSTTTPAEQVDDSSVLRRVRDVLGEQKLVKEEN